MLFILCFLFGVFGAYAENIAGECPVVKIQENLDFTRFSGSWYNVASFASDGRTISDCSTLDFHEDNLGFTLKETYISIVQGNRTQKSYLARVDPTFDAGNKAKLIVSYEISDNVLQYPFFILSTDYDSYAIAYTCKTYNKKPKTHYVFSWVLSRNKQKLEGESLRKVEDALSKYPDLAQHRQQFVFKEFSDAECQFSISFGSNFFSNNFW